MTAGKPGSGEALGKTGSAMPGGIYRVGLPRTDLKVTLDGVELKAGLCARQLARVRDDGRQRHGDGRPRADHGRGEPGHEEAHRGRDRGDGAAQPPAAQPALHDVHARSRPRRPGEARRGAAHRARREQDAARRRCRRRRAAAPPPIDLDTAALEQALGAKGTNNGGVYQFGIPRAEPIKDGGMAVPPAMGSANAINFQPTGGGKAAITGDFVLIAKEVNPVAEGAARARDRGHGAAQPHARRRAASVLHAFLGK